MKHPAAYDILKERAQRRDDLPRLREAFDLAWAMLEKRIANPAMFAERLAGLIAMMGNRRPDMEPALLAARVTRTFDAHIDQD